ncbi:hypothetical protein QCA50_003710 [Cerrena zonata]|uniref:ABC transporter domain-containing protein n=1 Tax=Cerrena zonata TaxID=2478898 RepID=A0AAW0GWZ6_9APHY
MSLFLPSPHPSGSSKDSPMVSSFPPVDAPPNVDVLEMGVWRAFRARTSNEDMSFVRAFSTYVVSLVRFLVDILKLIPPYTWAKYITCTLMLSFYASFRLYVDSRALGAIYKAWSDEVQNVWPVTFAIGTMVASSILVKAIDWYRSDIEKDMERLVNDYFNVQITDAMAHLCLTHIRNPSRRPHFSNAWYLFKALWNVVDATLLTVSNAGMFTSLTRDNHLGFPTLALSLLGPALGYYFSDNFHDRPYIYHKKNKAFSRANAMYRLATGDDYRLQVVANNLAGYISREYQAALSAYSTESILDPSFQYRRNERRFCDIVLDMANMAPLTLFALSALFNPGMQSISTLLVIRQLSSTIRTSITQVKNATDTWSKTLQNIEDLYQGLDSGRSTLHGNMPYNTAPKGMEFEFRNVTYKYPYASDQDRPLALDDVSFKIPTSSLVVLVGTNGSGKSSLLTLLARVQNPTSGQILLDGKAFTDYREEDIRGAISMKTPLIPILTMLENIAIGCEDFDKEYAESETQSESKTELDADPKSKPETRSPRNMVEILNEAAHLGLADTFLGSITSSLPTESRWNQKVFPDSVWQCGTSLTRELTEVHTKLNKMVGLSAGEAQRVENTKVFTSVLTKKEKNRLLLLDEPNSALDSVAEQALFKNILSVREGRTIVLALNRFSDTIMKSADLILCMKDGKLVESGTHMKLLGTDGEYSRLCSQTSERTAKSRPQIGTY